MDLYEDIIGLPHHVSPKRSPMSMQDRAAQFSPFAALTGFEAAIAETGRITDKKMELDDELRELLDRKQHHLQELIACRPEITVTYFVPDAKKGGGAYIRVSGRLKQVDEYARELILADGMKIPLDDIADIQSDCLHDEL